MQLTSLNGAQAGSPRWSPDGKTIAFDDRMEGHGDIFVISAEGGGELSQAAHGSAIDQTPLYTAQRLVQMSTSADELPLAQEALRLGDREMDLAFAAAVWEAQVHPAVLERRSETEPSQAAARRGEISGRRQGTGRATYRRVQRRPVLKRTAWRINWNKRKSRWSSISFDVHTSTTHRVTAGKAA